MKKKVLSIHRVLLSVMALGMSFMMSSCDDPLWAGQSNTEESASADFTGNLYVYMDASVSMKGFVTVRSSEFNRDVPIILSDLRGKLEQKAGEEYFMVKDWNETTQPVPVTYDQFKQQIIDPTGKEYKGQTTQLYSIIKQIASELKSGDVGIFITDGVLSEGPEIKNSKSDNSQFFGDLQREVKEALDVAYKRGLSMAIVRTDADYNGQYYCACNEKSVPAYKDSVMHQRPYFYFLLGEEQVLQQVLVSFTLKDTEKYQASYFACQPRNIEYSLAQTIKNTGLNSIEYPVLGDTIDDMSTLDVHIDLDGFYDDNDEETPEICLCLPAIEKGKMVKLDETVISDNDNFFTVKPITKAECREKVEALQQPSDEYWKRVGLCYLIKFKKSNDIRNATSDRSECQLSLIYANPLKDSIYSIDNDINKSLEEIQGRTFGFRQFMEAIELSNFKENMKDGLSKTATIKFNIIID